MKECTGKMTFNDAIKLIEAIYAKGSFKILGLGLEVRRMDTGYLVLSIEQKMINYRKIITMDDIHVGINFMSIGDFKIHYNEEVKE